MKKNAVTLLVMLALVLTTPTVGAALDGCVGIQSGTLQESLGNTLVMGYDQFGYNYQARMFNGTYDSVDRVLDGKY